MVNVAIAKPWLKIIFALIGICYMLKLIRSVGIENKLNEEFYIFVGVIVPCFIAFKKILLFLTDTRTPEEKSQAHKAIYKISFLSMTLTKTIHLRQNNIKLYQFHRRYNSTNTKHHTRQSGKKTLRKKIVVICLLVFVVSHESICMICRYYSETNKN